MYETTHLQDQFLSNKKKLSYLFINTFCLGVQQGVREEWKQSSWTQGKPLFTIITMKIVNMITKLLARTHDLHPSLGACIPLFLVCVQKIRRKTLLLRITLPTSQQILCKPPATVNIVVNRYFGLLEQELEMDEEEERRIWSNNNTITTNFIKNGKYLIWKKQLFRLFLGVKLLYELVCPSLTH